MSSEIDKNRPSDYVNQDRNSFGFKYPSNTMIVGTKGDVETFFLIVNDLIAQGILENSYRSISHDLYKTLINYRNLDDFITETAALKSKFATITSTKVEWEKYPFNRERGNYDYQQLTINPAKPNLLDVFSGFFKIFEVAIFFVKDDIDNSDLPNFARLIVAPTEYSAIRRYKKYTDDDFINAEDSPLWLREAG